MRGKFEDLAGRKFGNLIVEGYMGDRRWWCNCECGKVAIVMTQHLNSGHTKSCGCLSSRYCSSEVQRKSVTRHGFWDYDAKSPKMKFYLIWRNLRARCNNSNLKCYKNYGGRGITYDPRWNDFLEFKEDMYMDYLYATKQLKIKKLSIEREDVNGNYNKKNCTFINFNGQMKNTRFVITFIAISPKGEKTIEKNVNEFSKEHGLNSSHVYECLKGGANHHRGWKFVKR